MYNVDILIMCVEYVCVHILYLCQYSVFVYTVNFVLRATRKQFACWLPNKYV